MLSNPMRADRPVAGWAESLERMRTFEPMYVVPSHGVPLMGTDEIDTVLANYARAIRHVHDETLERIQRGLPLDVIRQQVSLPAELACLPYLQEHYGKVAWSVNGVYRQYTGWYSLNPADLNPVPHAQLARAVLEACGGAAPIVARARRALRNGQDQMALQLTDLVMTARPQHRGARAVRLEALERLAAATQNGVEQNIYRSAAAATSAWLADPFNAATSGFPWLDFSGVWRRQPRHLLDSALPPEKARRPPKQADRPGTAGTTVAVNRWYDTRMYADWAQDIYAGSDFHNYGYWTETTASPKEASENLMEVLLAFIPLKSGTILDVACGKGATTRHLLNYYRPRDVTGINISEKQLETCRANAPECTFLLMNATDLEFEDETFDNIICVEAAFHFDPRAKFLSEAHRVLKPGGRLVLSDIVAFEGLADRFPDGQLVLGPEDYRSLYFEAGFEQLEIVDATAECRSAFMRHHLRKLRERKRRGEIDATRFGRQKARILEKERYGGYYLLVSAQKANAVPAA
jgi:SAM-dependent methyltransferase